jgi:hypothetical protein
MKLSTKANRKKPGRIRQQRKHLPISEYRAAHKMSAAKLIY